MAPADEQSFEALALPHLDLVYRVALRLTRNAHAAEDLTQETFFKAYRAFDGFDLRSFGIKPWLLRILHNTFLNRQAREKKAPKATDQQTLEQTQATDDHAAPPELDYENLDEEVKQALDDLRPEFRTVMLLWATNELSYQEIADVLDVPIGTVMSRLHRARQQLAHTLSNYARENRIAGAKTDS